MFFVILTMVFIVALIADFRNASFFRSIARMPDTRKELDKATKLFMILLVVFMAWAQDKDSQQSSGNGDWLSGSELESLEGGDSSLMEGEAQPAAGITWAVLSGQPPYASNAVLSASQYLAGFACVGVTNIQPSALDAPAGAVAYTNWPYAVARQCVLLPQGCLPEGFTFGDRAVTNLYMAASGMLSFDTPKSSPSPATNGIPDATAANYIAVLQTPSDIVPTNGLFWYAPGTNSSLFTWKEVYLGHDTNSVATVQAELYANGDFTCRYYLPSLTNSYAQLTNGFLIGSQNNAGGETVLHTNALLAIHPSFLPAFELRWKSIAGLSPAGDHDGDGLTTADELFIYRTDPRRKDSDGDGITDPAEITAMTDPLNPDTNNDGIPDGIDLTGYSLSDTNLVFKLINNIAPSVDPNLDTDNDGWADWLEQRFGTDPNSAYSTPAYSDTYFSVTVTLASPPPETGVLAVGTNRVMVTGAGSWAFWRTSGEAHPVTFTSPHGVPPSFNISFNRPDASRYDSPAPDGSEGDFGKAALPLISFDPPIGNCCHEARTEAHCQTYTAYVMPPMPGAYDWDGDGTWSTNAPNVVAASHDVSWLRLRFTGAGASAYREADVWINPHCSMAGVETNNPGAVSVNNNDDDADETGDDSDTEITSGDPDLVELWPLGRFDGFCCQCSEHQPFATAATLVAYSQNLALYTDSFKTNAFGSTIHAGEAVYVEGRTPSTEPNAEKLVWEWTEDNETKSLTNALTVLSVRLFPDLDNDDDVDATDVAGLASLSSEYGWLMPASTNVLRKLRLRTDVGLSGGAYTLSLSGDAGAFRVWADNSGTNAAPLLVCGQVITNEVGGVTFLVGDDSDLYVEAASNGTTTITYFYKGEGDAANISCFAELKMTAFKLDLDLDSDNNNRYNPPDENATEEATEMDAPGKIIIVNVDDDNSDGYPDNTDAVISGNADREFDMATLLVKCGPGTWNPAEYDLVMESSNDDLIRIFKADGTLLLGPEMTGSCALQPSDLTNGRLSLVVEGVITGEVTVAVILKKTNDTTEIMRDEVLITVDEHLGRMPPAGFSYLSQHKDTPLFCLYCPSVKTNAPSHVRELAHSSYSSNCVHCANYCVNASVAMVNHYYGGNITQDEIAYSYRLIGGWSANNILGHGQGIMYPYKPLAWSLSLQESAITKVEHTAAQYDNNGDWHFIADSIISYRPVIIIIRTITGGRHACCTSGVRIDDDGIRWLFFWDPQKESQPEWRRFSLLEIDSLYTVSNASASSTFARQADISMTEAGDTDEDGLMTFDEVVGRFSIPPYNLTLNSTVWDSDNNGTNDLQEVKNRIFYLNEE
jgi:hypothetical protein